MTTGELPAASGPRLGRPGHSDSIPNMTGPNLIIAWATFPLGPGLLTISRAPKALAQKSISVATSRQKSRGMIAETPVGTPLVAFDIFLPLLSAIIKLA